MEELLILGIIRSPDPPYAFPIVAVKKRDNTLRIYVDFRKLSKITAMDEEVMPNVHDLYAKWHRWNTLQNYAVRKVIDTLLWEDSKHVKRFLRQLGTLCGDTWLTFEFSPANSIFTRFIKKMTKERTDTVSYLDYILLFHHTPDKHVDGLRTMQLIDSLGWQPDLQSYK